MSRSSCFLVPLILFAFSIAGIAQDQSTGPSLEQLKSLTKTAAQFYRDKNYAQSADQIRQAQALLDQLIADLKREHGRVERARQLLIDNGQSLPELVPFPGNEAAAAEPATSSTASASPTTSGATAQVSFTNDVVPVLTKHCGNCHMRQARGQFSAASYAELLKGTRKGPGVTPGKPEDSSVVTLVEAKKMPPRSQGIPAAELQILKDWVSQGAPFDGSDENAKISVPGGPGPASGRGAAGLGSDN